jgi:ferredoxin
MNDVFPAVRMTADRPTVRYGSDGNLLVVGPRERALPAAERLADALTVSVLLTDGPVHALPGQYRFPVCAGHAIELDGWLGAFGARWRQDDVFEPVSGVQADLVLDLGDSALIGAHQSPKGYYHAGGDAAALEAALAELPEMTGEFEKPVYFRYQDRLCAHSRNGQPGCGNCIAICSAQAITSDGDGVRVDPHLCAGCGACTTVCPTGALTYDYPAAPVLMDGVRHAIAAHVREHGASPVLLFHTGPSAVWPTPAIAVQVQHTASVGIEVWLAAVAWGATAVVTVLDGDEAPAYVEALRAQMTVAQEILAGLGYAGTHLGLDYGQSPAVGGDTPQPPAGFNLAGDKRVTLQLALDHLAACAPAPRDLLAVHVLRRRLSVRRAAGQPRRAAAALHRAQLRAVRPVRRDLSRGRAGAAAAPVAGPGGEDGGGAQRDAAVLLHPLQQAVRHLEGGRDHAGPAERAQRVRRPSGAAAHVRRLPRDRHDAGWGGQRDDRRGDRGRPSALGRRCKVADRYRR